MSAAATITLICDADGPQCPIKFTMQTRSKAEAREYAELAGWRIVREFDYIGDLCPAHRDRTARMTDRVR